MARALSIITLLLLFASSIVTMVHDIQAVNAFVAAGKANPSIRLAETNSTDSGVDCFYQDTDYVECVFSVCFRVTPILTEHRSSVQRQHRAQPARWCLLGSAQPAAHHLPGYRPHSL